VDESNQREHLRGLLSGDPADPCFAALAESYRREGRAADAERVLRAGIEAGESGDAAWSVLCLTLLDEHRYDEAREVLYQRADLLHGRYFGAHPFDAGVEAKELDLAFERAEPDAEQVVDADRVALVAMREANLDAPEDLALVDSAYATETMAKLLAKQGDRDGAARIRERLSLRETAGRALPVGSRVRRVEILERWLRNVRALA
jgi:tetratricopeptide (TPR) repeat protein